MRKALVQVKNQTFRGIPYFGPVYSTAPGSCQVLPPGTSSGYFRRLLLLFVLYMPTSQLVAGEHGHGVFGGHESEVIRTFYMKYCKFLKMNLRVPPSFKLS